MVVPLKAGKKHAVTNNPFASPKFLGISWALFLRDHPNVAGFGRYTNK
jgi:hypothetical protein